MGYIVTEKEKVIALDTIVNREKFIRHVSKQRAGLVPLVRVTVMNDTC